MKFKRRINFGQPNHHLGNATGIQLDEETQTKSTLYKYIMSLIHCCSLPRYLISLFGAYTYGSLESESLEPRIKTLRRLEWSLPVSVFAEWKKDHNEMQMETN